MSAGTGLITEPMRNVRDVLREMADEAWMHFHCTEDEAMCLWIRSWHQRVMLALLNRRGQA